MKDKKLREFLFGSDKDRKMDFKKFAGDIKEAKTEIWLPDVFNITKGDREGLSIQEELDAIKEYLKIEVIRTEEKLIIKKIKK